MKTCKGNLFDNVTKDTVLVVTTNSVLVKDWLVMGAGAAKAMADTYNEAPFWAFEAILDELVIKRGYKSIDEAIHGNVRTGVKSIYETTPVYGYLMIRSHDGVNLGIFQTKRNYRDMSDIELIKLSTNMLAKEAKSSKLEYRLNYPGIGLGGLTKDVVHPIISILPDNVTIYEL